ncbi:ShlB/FhaC/HecB family hemolysin secretion/activation protein [Salinisphaera aquimarina]|uniref:ShlB/FhaC/HecB family hemolysin secretion/activation protein n=1 Tax=Salinisphaera aquimarina TaxID=2094031 RepID=A0ABV7EMT7_9GAMM
MPFDLPPPVPPMQAEVAPLRQRDMRARRAGRIIAYDIGPYRIEIAGNSYLQRERVLSIIAQASTPSQAIRLLTALYTADGHPLVNLDYAADGNTILVQVNEGYLAAIEAPPRLLPFFDRLVGERDIERSDLEPARLLAQIKAGRAGYDVNAAYRVDPNDPTRYTLVLDGARKLDYQPLTWTTTFGNPGNRFLGRYFGFTNLKGRLPNGDTVALGYGAAFTGLGNPRNGTDYDNYSVAYTTVNRFGLYGLSATYTEYGIKDRFDDRLFVGERERARIVDVGASGNQFIYADRSTRLILEEQLQYVKSDLEFTDGDGLVTNGRLPLNGLSLQDEEYGAARVGLTASHTRYVFGREINISGGGGYKHGFGDIDNVIASDRSADFARYDGKFTVRYHLPSEWVLSLHGKGQLSGGDTLPQQQQWVLGGSDNLSAYLPGVLVGDSGAYGRVQLQTPRWFLFSRPLRLAAFVEAGSARYENSVQPDVSASDYGLKLEASPLPHLEVSAYVANGLSSSNLDVYDDDFKRRNEADFFFTVKTEF